MWQAGLPGDSRLRAEYDNGTDNDLIGYEGDPHRHVSRDNIIYDQMLATNLMPCRLNAARLVIMYSVMGALMIMALCLVPEEKQHPTR